MAGTILKFDELPDWTVEVDEIALGAYRVLARHKSGPTIDLTGSDHEELLARLKISALAMESEIKAKIARGKN